MWVEYEKGVSQYLSPSQIFILFLGLKICIFGKFSGPSDEHFIIAKK